MVLAGAPPASGWEPGEFLDVDVDELAGPIALITADRWRSGPVTAVETTQALSAEDALHRRGSEADLMSDVVGTPTMFPA